MTRSTKGVTMPTDNRPTATDEPPDLLPALAKQRSLLRLTLRDMTEEQGTRRPTVSELCLGGLIKHVAAVESHWVDFILEGPGAMAYGSEEWNVGDWLDNFRVLPGETLAG